MSWYFGVRRRAALQMVSASSPCEYVYEVVDNEYVRLLFYFGTSVDATVPEEIEGLPVKEIFATCFNYSSVQSVVIPSGVEKIL